MKILFFILLSTFVFKTYAQNLPTCSKEVEKKIKKIHRACSKKNAPEGCLDLIGKNGCNETLQAVSQLMKGHIERIQDELVNNDFSQPEVKNRIYREIKLMKKISKVLADEKDIKVATEQIENTYKVIAKLTKRDADFMNKTHSNGLTSRQIARKLSEPQIKNHLVTALGNAHKIYKTNGKSKGHSFVNVLRDELVKDNELVAVLPFNKKDGRMIATLGLNLFGCADETDEDNGGFLVEQMHLLLYGKKECDDGGAEFIEHVIGPGLYFGNHSKAVGAICLGDDQKFYGVGVTAGGGALIAGAQAGVYVGTGVCVKVEISLIAIGAYAGLSYLKIDGEGVNVFKEMINQ